MNPDKKDMLLFYLKMFGFNTALWGIMYFSIVINSAEPDPLLLKLLIVGWCCTTYYIIHQAIKTYYTKYDDED